jgi:hypothetical protein
MYLGFLPGLAGWAVFLSNALAFIFLPVFVLYLNRFQIRRRQTAAGRHDLERRTAPAGLGGIRNAAQQSVQETLGTHYSTCQRRNGWWLNNIAPAPPRPTR